MATPKHITFTLRDNRFDGINETQRSGIASEIINTIQNRTASGRDKDGNQFASYKASYVNSAHFKDAGKSSNVNLAFSDEMMNSLTYLPELSSGDEITVGFANGSEVNRRAQYVIEGHGRKGDFTQAKRDPMGLTSDERSRIVGLVPETGGSTSTFLALGAAFLASIF